jgi:hypothetical protein
MVINLPRIMLLNALCDSYDVDFSNFDSNTDGAVFEKAAEI